VVAGHPDRVLRAGVDAEAAEDAAQHVDVEDDRVLFVGDLRVLAGDDRDAFGRAGLLAHVAGHALEGPILPGLQDVAAAEAAGVVALGLGVLDRRQPPEVREVLEEMADRHPEPAHDRRVIEALRERQLARSPAADVDDAAHRSSSPAMTFNVPSVAIASEIVPPTMIFSKAAMFGKQGGRTFNR